MTNHVKENTMAQKISEVMTHDPITMPATASTLEAARAMRDSNIGTVVVVDNGKVCGIVTDRDIVVRAVAQGRDPATTKLRDIGSHDLTTLALTDTVEHAVQVMRAKAIRRLPVVENGKPVGIVSLGDLALERDPDSALGSISAAPANR
jgi:CBS domain-containing protein